MRAVNNLRRPNKHDSDAVDARREIDLRLGAIFTRFQTLNLAKKFSELESETISYGMNIDHFLQFANFVRSVPVSHFRICCRPILANEMPRT